MPGPPPKRSEQRRRKNVPEAGAPVKAPTEPAEVPDADPEWHDIASRWFESLKRSGQSAFYTSADWMTAFAVAESMSREFQPQPLVVGSGKDATVEMHKLPPKAASLTAWLKACSGLLVLEGDRRRVALELQPSKPDDEEGGDVSHLHDARLRLRGAG